MERSRICGAPFHVAPRAGHNGDPMADTNKPGGYGHDAKGAAVRFEIFPEELTQPMGKW
jgi:hypothetical protein